MRAARARGRRQKLRPGDSERGRIHLLVTMRAALPPGDGGAGRAVSIAVADTHDATDPLMSAGPARTKIARNATCPPRSAERPAAKTFRIRVSVLPHPGRPRSTANLIPMKKYSILMVLCLAGVSLASWGADAAANWKEHCTKCHGDTGKGDTKMGRKLDIRDISKADVQAKFTDEEALKSMKDGLKDKDGKVLMKPAEGLSEADMKALVAYVRGLKK